jgi:hypothetical protein
MIQLLSPVRKIQRVHPIIGKEPIALIEHLTFECNRGNQQSIEMNAVVLVVLQIHPAAARTSCNKVSASSSERGYLSLDQQLFLHCNPLRNHARRHEFTRHRYARSSHRQETIYLTSLQIYSLSIKKREKSTSMIY